MTKVIMRHTIPSILFILLLFTITGLKAQSIQPGDTESRLLSVRGEPDQRRGINYVYKDYNDVNSTSIYTVQNGYVTSKMVSWVGDREMYEKMIIGLTNRLGKKPDSQSEMQGNYFAVWQMGSKKLSLNYGPKTSKIILLTMINF